MMWRGGCRPMPVPMLPGNRPPAGELVATTTFTHNASPTTTTGTANRIVLYQWVPPLDLKVDQARINVTTIAAGSLAKVLFYTSDRDGNPAALMGAESPDFDCGTAGERIAALATPLVFRAGRRYWAGLRYSAGQIITGWQYSSIPDLQGGAAVSTSSRKSLRRSLAYANAAPSSWGFLTSEINSDIAPAIWLRVAA